MFYSFIIYIYLFLSIIYFQQVVKIYFPLQVSYCVYLWQPSTFICVGHSCTSGHYNFTIWFSLRLFGGWAWKSLFNLSHSMSVLYWDLGFDSATPKQSPCLCTFLCSLRVIVLVENQSSSTILQDFPIFCRIHLPSTFTSLPGDGRRDHHQALQWRLFHLTTEPFLSNCGINSIWVF